MLASCSADHDVRLWKANSGAAGKVLKGHTEQVYSLAVNRKDPKEVASGSFNGEVKIWDVINGVLIKEFNASPNLPPQAAAANPAPAKPANAPAAADAPK